MDEPTNDLDIETLELLEELIADFPARCCSSATTARFSTTSSPARWRSKAAAGSSSTSAAGGLPAPAGRDSRGAAEKAAGSRRGDQSSPTPVAPAARAKKLSFKEQREFEELPARIEALEKEQRQLTQESESAEFYKAGADHIRTVLARLGALPGELEETLRRWLELEERAKRR